MISLKASTAGKSKQAYIEEVVEDCKTIFNSTFAEGFFDEDNLKLAFCTSENQEAVYDAFCGAYFPLYLAEQYSGRTALQRKP